MTIVISDSNVEVDTTVTILDFIERDLVWQREKVDYPKIENTPEDRDVATFHIDDGKWYAEQPPGATSGEANTASNLGTLGQGVYKTKTGVNLEFKKLRSDNNFTVITSDSDSIIFTISSSNIANALNLSGTNTGDDAVNNNYSSLTQYTDELAQDAVGGIFNSTLTYVDGIPSIGVSNPVVPQETGFIITAGVTAKTLTVAETASVSGTNSGDDATNSQYSGLVSNATHTGDVTGSAALTIANKAVTLAKMNDMATSSLIYRKSAGSGAPEVNSLTTLKSDLGLSNTNSGDQDLSSYFNKTVDDADDVSESTDRKFASPTEKSTWNGKQNALGFTPENVSNKGAASGYAGLDETGKVPSAQLPSFVDDILEYAAVTSFPVTGETGKIYVALDTNEIYRWGGSSYTKVASGAVSSVNSKTGAVTLNLSEIAETDDVKHVSPTEKSTWNAKQNALSEGTDYLNSAHLAETYEPKKGTDDNFVTDAEKTILSNTSNTNSGDNAVNNNYSGLVSNATHSGDVAGATTLTIVKRIAMVTAVERATNVAVASVFDFIIPAELNGMNLVYFNVFVITAGTTNATTADLYNVTDSHSMLSGYASVASGGLVGTPATIDTNYDDVVTNDYIRGDVKAVSTTPPKGLIAIFKFQTP